MLVNHLPKFSTYQIWSIFKTCHYIIWKVFCISQVKIVGGNIPKLKGLLSRGSWVQCCILRMFLTMGFTHLTLHVLIVVNAINTRELLQFFSLSLPFVPKNFTSRFGHVTNVTGYVTCYKTLGTFYMPY
jgi:hypothetical protein